MVQGLADSTKPQKGYNAVIGMLKYLLPLDFKRSLQVMLKQLSNVVCEKVKKAQSVHAIKFRTRYKCGDCYPFDSQTFKKDQYGDSKSKSSAPNQAKEIDKEDLIPFVSLSQNKTPDGKLVDKTKELKVVTTATFFETVKLNSIKVYM